MASITARTTRIRKRKKHNRGKVRKRKIRKSGTTKSEKELFGD